MLDVNYEHTGGIHNNIPQGNLRIILDQHHETQPPSRIVHIPQAILIYLPSAAIPKPSGIFDSMVILPRGRYCSYHHYLGSCSMEEMMCRQFELHEVIVVDRNIAVHCMSSVVRRGRHEHRRREDGCEKYRIEWRRLYTVMGASSVMGYATH
jgi:hypothetical protein